MATLSELVKKRRQSGQGVFQSLGTSLKEKIKESIDPRQFLDQSGLLVALFPQLKAYRADVKRESGLSIQRKTSEIVNRSVELSDNSLDVIEKNTQITAKNLLILPAMARDVNVLRQNFSKLMKAFNVTPTNKADAFFKKSSEREAEFESKFKKTPTPRSTQNLESTDKEKSSGFLSFIGDFLGAIIKNFLMIARVMFTMLSRVISGILTGLIGKIFRVVSNFLMFRVLGMLTRIVGLISAIDLLKLGGKVVGTALSKVGGAVSLALTPSELGDATLPKGMYDSEGNINPKFIAPEERTEEEQRRVEQEENSPSKVTKIGTIDEQTMVESEGISGGPVGGLVTPAITPVEQKLMDEYNSPRIKYNLDPLPLEHPEIQEYIRKYKSTTSVDVPKDNVKVEPVKTSSNSNQVADQLNQYFNDIKVARSITPTEDMTTIIPNQQNESSSFQDSGTRMASVINEDILPYFSGGMNVNAV